MITIAQLIAATNDVKSTPSNLVEWNNNSLQNVHTNYINPIIQERGLYQVENIAAMQALGLADSYCIGIDGEGIFFWRATGPANNTTIFSAADGGFWVLNANVGGGATSLSGLLDVDLNNPQNGQSLVFDGTVWVNSTVGGATTLAGLNDVLIPLAPLQDGQFLIYDDLPQKWINATVNIPTNLTDLNDIAISNPQSGQTITYNSGSGKWVNTTAGLTTIYSGNGTVAAARTVTANVGGGAKTGAFRLNLPSSGAIQMLAYKDSGVGAVANVLVAPLNNPSDATTSPAASVTAQDVVGGAIGVGNIGITRDMVTLQNVYDGGAAVKSFSLLSQYNGAVWQDINGYGIDYGADYSANFNNLTLVPKGWVATRITSATGTASGDSATTSFNFPHGQSGVPARVVDAPTSQAAAATHWISAVDATNITVTFAAAPPTATNNITFNFLILNNN